MLRKDLVDLDFDASFERYARLDQQGGITVCRRTNGQEEVLVRLRARGKRYFFGPRMSPDGRCVAFGHGAALGGVECKEVLVWRLDGPGRDEPLVVPEGMCWHALAYRLDRRQLAVGHADGAISVYDLESRTRVRRLELGGPARQLAFHPKDGRLAVAAGGAVRLFDVDTGKELPALHRTAPGVGPHCVCWHPDGRRLAAVYLDRKIHLWDTQTTSEVAAPWLAAHYETRVAFNPAGDLLVGRSSWGTRVWDATTGRHLLTMPDSYGSRFSHDGQLLGWSWEGKRVRLWRLAAGHELRVLRRRHTVGLENLSTPIFCEDGRTLATISNYRWLSFFDVVRGEELASVPCPLPNAYFPVFFNPPAGSPTGERRALFPPDWRDGLPEEEQAGGWITRGHGSVFFWPARLDAAQPTVLRVGPPRFLVDDAAKDYSDGASASQDGRVLAMPRGHSTLLWHRGRPERQLVLGPQTDVRFSAVSPKGEWVVTSSHWSDGLSNSAWIWDAETGRRVHELPVRGSTRARFSPDGRWLVTSTDSTEMYSQLWEVGSWREVRRLGASAVFSPDSRLLACNGGLSVVRLEEIATGREVARLTGPESVWYRPACFTPDSARLIVGGHDEGSLGVWDLRTIRAQLKELGLDWHWPEFGPAEPESAASRPLRVEVLSGDASKPPLTREERARQAIEHNRQRLEANPNDAHACNNLAWHYLTAPEGVRDVKAALPLAEKAVQLAPKSPDYANTLGLAYYRARRYAEAAAVLRANLDKQEDSCLGFELFFLAMCHHELGEPARARDYYDWAVRWMRTHKGRSPSEAEELAESRAEAEQLLGVKKTK